MPSTREMHGKYRDEIIESQKLQSDLLKWKLIAVAAIAAASLGIGTQEIAKDAGKSVSFGSRWLLCLVPLICAYVDFISIHYMLRIVTIGAYLKSTGDPYETVVSSLKRQKGRNPFVFESIALQGSSIFFNFALFFFGSILLGFKNDWAFLHKVGYILAGLFGIAISFILIYVYRRRQAKVAISVDMAAATAAANAATDSAAACTHAVEAITAALAAAAPFRPAVDKEYIAAAFAAEECKAAIISANAAAKAAKDSVAADCASPGLATAAVAASNAAARAADLAAHLTNALVEAMRAQPTASPEVVAKLAVETIKARTAALVAAAATDTVER